MPYCTRNREHSPWVSRLLSELGHEAIVAHARNVRLIGESKRKDDGLDAFTLARLVRIDPQLLCPVKHRSAEAQADLIVIRARAALVRNRTTLVNAARGPTKSYGEKLGRGNARSMKPKAAQDLSPELKNALGPLMREIESVSERIRDYDELLESMAQNKYPEAERLKQIKGVGTLIALTYMLTLEDPSRFRKKTEMQPVMWASSRGGGIRDRVSRRCASAKRAIHTCERCWYRLHITYSGHGESTATCAGGDEVG
jgi:transposase